MSVPGYESYRQSGVEWNPEVPAHWTDTRLRFVAKLNPSKSEIASRDRQEDVSFVPMDAVGDDGSVRLDQTRPIGEVETGYTYFANGDVTVAKITPCFENGKGAVMRGLQGGIGFGTTELIVARPSTDTSADFLHWLFTSSAFRKLGERAMYGAGGQKRVSDDFVRDFPVAMPPYSEQTAIAAFLDRETGKIDALVSAQRRLIELLKEKRQAVISHAVTKGLDPTAPMKDSGVDWLGEIPAHWSLSPLKRVAKVRYGIGEPPAYHDAGIPLIRATNVDAGKISPKGLVYVDPADIPERRIVWLAEGDIIVVRSGAYTGDSAIIGSSHVPSIAGFDMVVSAFDCHPMYLQFSLLSRWIKEGQIDLEKTRAAQPHLNAEELGDVVLTLPPADEQDEICRRLSCDVATLDAMSDDAEAAILLLQERRAALISAAVTGKIDVRGLAPNQAEAA